MYGNICHLTKVGYYETKFVLLDQRVSSVGVQVFPGDPTGVSLLYSSSRAREWETSLERWETTLP